MTKKRLQFDVTDSALEEIDRLKEAANAPTRADVVRNALRLYAWFLKYKTDGYTVQVQKGSESKTIELLF